MTILPGLKGLLFSTSLRSSRGVRESQSRQQRSLAEFEHLYQLHSRDLYSFCLETVGNRAEAEELVKVAFLHLFGQADDLHGGVPSKILLYRCVLSALRAPIAAHKEEPSQETATGRDPASVPGGIGQQSLRNAIAELPPDLRIVFVLHDVLGYEPREIAEILESSPRTSRWQAHQARLRVREALLRTGWKARGMDRNLRPPPDEPCCETDPAPGIRGHEASSVGHAMNSGPTSTRE